MVEIYLERSDNEILAAKALLRLSESDGDKVSFEIPAGVTFYSSVISHCYYSIFYAAKSILMSKGVKTEAPEVHKKTFDEFKRVFVDSGVLDLKFLEIYNEMIVRADHLLDIFREEKWKRGNFTYKTIPQANREPAQESLENAKFFLRNASAFLKG